LCRSCGCQKAETQLEQVSEELMREAEIDDAKADGKVGNGKRGSDLLAELQRRQDRVVKMRQARKKLEADAGDWSQHATASRRA
jgi:hypothetical protein